MNYHSVKIEDVLKKVNSSKSGLTFDEYKKRIDASKNIIPSGKEKSFFDIFISEFNNPMDYILILTVILSFIIGEKIDAIVLTIIILIDALVGTIEEYRANATAKSLSNMVKVMTRVLRNGKEQEAEASNLVVGDIILLESGDKISADARIIECHNFQVDESALTGESVSVEKHNKVLKESTILADRKNMIYAGTNVISGRCTAVIVNTGIDTEIGKIAVNVTETKEEKSPLTIRMEKFSKQISVFIIGIAIIVFAILMLSGNSLSEVILNVIALSVSAMPEGLALAFTMALTIASRKMSKKNVIVKKLNSVESLGSCTVIASDKTGTLTVNEQTIEKIILKDGSTFNVTGSGYNDVGDVIPLDKADINKAYKFAYLGYINNEAHLEKQNGEWEAFGDSIDIAFLSLAKKMKVKNDEIIIERVSYESENQYSAVFYKKNNKLYCTIKGSLEKVMAFSEETELYKKQNKDLTSKGYRVIAIANGEVKGTNISDIKKLDFIGLAAFIDPIRIDAKKSIEECIKSGIKVVMITGDHPLTAFAISRKLGLCTDFDEVATSIDIAKYRDLGEKEFDEFIKNKKVFSRVTPTDKLDIVNSYKRNGEFVAVTGDGVNDAPALKSANIGISMGSGTDVSKETSSMIIIDDKFTSIVEGIKEGRIAYSNIRKITLFLLSCGFAEIAFFILSIIFGYKIPLVAIQLLWLNLVTDGLQDISLSFEDGDESIMLDKPRSTKESLFSKDLIIEILILGISITLIVFIVWDNMMRHNVDINYARSVIMMLMVFIQNVNVLNCRSEKKSIFTKHLFSNPFVFITITGSILLQVLFSNIPITATALKIVPLNFITTINLFLLSLVIIVIFELYKFIYNNIKI